MKEKINITKENKELLFKDLSARLPYHVKVKVWIKDGTTEEGALDLEHNYANVLLDAFYYNKIKDIKPYLFPLTSMTDEQNKELSDILFNLEMGHLQDNETGFTIKSSKVAQAEIDWYNKNHFDYRGLIEKSLALDATNLNIY